MRMLASSEDILAGVEGIKSDIAKAFTWGKGRLHNATGAYMFRGVSFIVLS